MVFQALKGFWVQRCGQPNRVMGSGLRLLSVATEEASQGTWASFPAPGKAAVSPQKLWLLWVWGFFPQKRCLVLTAFMPCHACYLNHLSVSLIGAVTKFSLLTSLLNGLCLFSSCHFMGFSFLMWIFNFYPHWVAILSMSCIHPCHGVCGWIDPSAYRTVCLCCPQFLYQAHLKCQWSLCVFVSNSHLD